MSFFFTTFGTPLPFVSFTANCGWVLRRFALSISADAILPPKGEHTLPAGSMAFYNHGIKFRIAKKITEKFAYVQNL